MIIKININNKIIKMSEIKSCIKINKEQIQEIDYMYIDEKDNVSELKYFIITFENGIEKTMASNVKIELIDLPIIQETKIEEWI